MRLLVLTGLLAAAFGAGCGSTVNQEACAKYVDHLNSLECREDVDVESTCPKSYDGDGAVSCVDFFSCLTSAASCDGDVFTNTAAADCTSCEVPQ